MCIKTDGRQDMAHGLCMVSAILKCNRNTLKFRIPRFKSRQTTMKTVSIKKIMIWVKIHE